MALIDDIRNAQRDAGERLVMEDLARKGVLGLGLGPEDKAKLNAEFGPMGNTCAQMEALVYAERRVYEQVRQEVHEALRADRDGISPYNTIVCASFGPRMLEVIKKFAKLQADASIKVGVADEQDTARLDWVLPIITGEDDAIANNRTIALAGCLAHGRNGRDTIDLARKVVG